MKQLTLGDISPNYVTLQKSRTAFTVKGLILSVKDTLFFLNSRPNNLQIKYFSDYNECR